MRNLGAVEAANEIRDTVFNTPGLAPEELHHVRYVTSVCDQLGLEPTPGNMHKVATALHKHDIGMYAGQEYPKYAVRGYDKAQKIVHDEQEANDWENEAAPEPAEPAGKIVEDHPNPNLDLTDQVPGQPKTADHPAGRASDAETNAAASQVAHVEPAADDEVHVEDVEIKSSEEPKSGRKNKRPE